MASTESTMLELGTLAPEFNLPNPLTDSMVKSSDFAGKPLLVAFICNHCPYVIHILDNFSRFANDYQKLDLQTVAINANDITNYPDDSPDKMLGLIKKYSLTIPYLFDETQSVAKNYTAACTPDFFLFNHDGALFYRGQYDGARPRNDVSVTGNSLKDAADALLSNADVYKGSQLASMGCNIKWIPGNEPDYY